MAALVITALVSPGALGLAAARVSDTTTLGDIVATGLTERDSDNDGLSDSLENYVYGTDPANWDSAGLGIPDGWLVQFGYDPLDPLTASARGKAPPPEKVPATYGGRYPAEFTPPLQVYYDYARPADYRPGTDAPWWRRGEHADPVAADQTGTGIPTGWLLHHGVPLKDLQPDVVAAGSLGNLTIRQAFERNTDPLESDSDGDGLDDWTEIHVTKTDPGRFSTAGVGIADGWAIHFRLDPFDARMATDDPDRDGLTNFEEFNTSWDALRAERLTQGPNILLTKGLNPRDWQTAQTGIPDGWYVKYGLSPFGTDVDRVIGRASDFEEYRDFVPEGESALPDITFTVRGAYEYARPSDWNESVKGVWWGGTNPVTLDSDGDGLPDPIEIRGWYANVTFDTGPEAKPRVYLATGNPLEPDSDGDGLTDLEEYRGRTSCGGETERVFPPTNPRNRDTAFSGLSDQEKVCGIVRGATLYDVSAKTGAGLDPTRADSASDHVKDGVRFDYWHARADELRASPRYTYNGNGTSPKTTFATVFDWTEKYARFAGLTRDQTLAEFRPDGDIDGDGIINVVDADPSGGLYVEKFGAPGDPKTKVYFLGGPQIDPSAYRLTEFASPVPHSATDPANPDTDGDGLPDSWETRYGRFDPARGGWDLDPANKDSDGDGVTDDKANNDGDVVVWYSFERRGASTERTTNSFVFDNALEFLAGTDPNEESSMNDGVPDGWKAFWGSRISSATYPNLVGSRDPSLGSIALDAIADIETALAASPITPTSDLRGVGAKATGYVRLVNVSSCSIDLTTLPNAGERIADVNPCFAGSNLDNQPIKVARIYGAAKLTYADESRLRTNPYLSDTDGDRAPDAYEAYFLVRLPSGANYPDPVVDDGARDADGDGLGVREECGSEDGLRCSWETFLLDDVQYGAGADPGRTDTDLDGIEDGIETAAGGLNPLDPSDIASFARADVDSDHDGLPDFVELTGKGSKTFFPEVIRTNPKDPDSDGDGLLDGETQNRNPANPAHAVDIAAWKALGIAHRTQTNGSIDFLGERLPGFGVRPDKLDSRATGIPDGWIAYYGLDTTRTFDASAYTAHRPTWWVEATHGVWWWGEKPGAAVPADADGDGLHDRNGEDPFPATNRLNRVVDGNLTITDPKDLEDWVKAAGSAAAQRLRAQRVGDGAGSPESARASALNLVDPATNVLVRDMRACVALLDVAAPSTIHKGVAFNVTGRVVLNERASGVCGSGSGALLEGDGARVGLANRTVLVSVFSASASRVVGAGFTNATGGFNLTANITEHQRYTIPADGLTLLGSVGGVATTRFDPAQLATGANTGTEANRLVVWVYNSSATAAPGSPTHAPHLARVQDRNGAITQVSVNATRFAASDAIPVVVRAGTSLAMKVEDVAQNGQKLAGEVLLTDASGAPLIDRPVLLTWTGATPPIELRNLSTDRDGVVNLTRLGLPVFVSQPDEYTLTANFTSADPNLVGSERTLAIQVRNPTTIVGAPDATAYTVGEVVSVTGEVRTLAVSDAGGGSIPASKVADAIVTLSIGGVEESARSDADGRFTVRLAIPGAVSAGKHALEVSFAGTKTDAPSRITVPLDVKRTSGIVDLNRVEGPRTIEVALRGRLIDNEGQGFGGPIEVHHAKAGMLARGNAQNDGSFFLTVPLRSLDLGAQTLRVVFPGDVGHAPTDNVTQARITSATRLAITEVPDVVVRGTTFPMRVTLMDDENVPVVGQPITGFWRGERLEVKVTDARGVVTFIIATNASERPVTTAAGVDFVPTATGFYQPATAGVPVRVVTGVRLELGDASVPRGPTPIAGRLLDDEGRPLPGSAITLALDGVRLGEARTSRNGSFEFLHILPEATKLGPHALTARFAGTSTLANVTTESTWHVRSPLLVGIDTLGPIVRGENAPLDARLEDDRGAPVDVALRVFLAGRDLGEVRSSGGALRLSLPIPADLPRGPATLRLSAPVSAAYEALEFEVPVVIKIRPTVEVELPTVAVRGFAIGGGVTLVDDRGEPLRNTSYAYAIGSGKGAVVAATNADGKGAVAGVAPISGDSTLTLTVRGGSDVVPVQYASKTMRVVGPATPIGYAALAVAVLVVLAIVGLIVAAVMLRRRQLEEARDILDEAIRDLLAGNEYAGTIFLAYRRFTAFLSRHGFAEKASDTPREFALGVRKALPIGAGPLRALIGLFEEARYSDHPIGSAERDRVVQSLTDVRRELDAMLGARKAAAPTEVAS